MCSKGNVLQVKMKQTIELMARLIIFVTTLMIVLTKMDTPVYVEFIVAVILMTWALTPAFDILVGAKKNE